MCIKRPVLAATMDKAEIKTLVRWPVLASAKLDGIRVLCHDTLGLVSRTFTAIPNVHVRKIMADPKYVGVDGEIVAIREDGSVKEYYETESEIMTIAGEPKFKVLAFDDFTAVGGFSQRLGSAMSRFAGDQYVEVLEHKLVASWQEMYQFIDECKARKVEGVCFRQPGGKYKEGRSTVSEQILVKWKEWVDADGVVVGFVESQTNTNKLETSGIGLAKRSTAKAGMVGTNSLGVLLVKTEKWGVLKVSAGGTEAERLEVWQNRDKYVGRLLTFKYQPFGMKKKPRLPIFLRWRNDGGTN